MAGNAVIQLLLISLREDMARKKGLKARKCFPRVKKKKKKLKKHYKGRNSTQCRGEEKNM